MRRATKVLLVGAFLTTLFGGTAQAGPCGNLGDVCYEILHRPMNQICNRWEICP